MIVPRIWRERCFAGNAVAAPGTPRLRSAGKSGVNVVSAIIFAKQVAGSGAHGTG
jgi:hypothetical protein